MTAVELLDMAKAEGVALMLDGSRLTWRANHQPPDLLLSELKSHKPEIIQALKATSGHGDRNQVWRVIRKGKTLCVMIGAPMTDAVALEHARWHWPDAEVMRVSSI